LKRAIDLYAPRQIEIFNIVKPVIGMIHLKPLPGTPKWENDLEDIIDYALGDFEALIAGGVDGIILENFMDRPFKQRIRDPETIAAFSIIAWEIRKRATVPVGINLLRNSGIEAMAIACIVGADFIRVNAYSEPLWSSEGLLQPIARDIQSLKSKLNCKVKIFADVNCKHSKPIMDLIEASIEAHRRGSADALIVSGSRTGEPVNPIDLYLVRKYTSIPIVLGSGARPGNLGMYWKLVDAFIVGTYFKRHGNVFEPVDTDRVKRFMEKVKWFRKKYGYST